MSEEILKALTQLFAIITKQDEGVTEVERQFVEGFFQQRLSQDSVKEYLALYENHLVEKTKKKERVKRPDRPDRPERADRPERKAKLTSMKDSVRTLAICKKINKTLTQKQKVIVTIELLEVVNSDKNFTSQRREILNTVSTVFNISSEEYKVMENFVLNESPEALDFATVLTAAHDDIPREEGHFLHSEKLRGYLYFMYVPSVDLYFVKYNGEDEIILNSQVIYSDRVYLYSSGSILKPAKGSPIYYTDLVAQFNQDAISTRISFNCKNMGFQFPNGHIGLRNINITENRGQLIGIMGASGAGKTTLLNVLAGIESPTSGEVLINGIDIHKNSDLVKGVIGYIAQDDILIEDLTVFENLYYNAKLCFKEKSEEEITVLVDEVLQSLGLLHIKQLKVGNVLNKKISGGQRKRLNIALELIREPAVMFVDEPTSGLSSRDSENVIELLKELSLKGKLIFVVIHQPSSDIYKMFDKMFLMDTGGYPVFYGSPVEAVIHFKTATNQINSDRGQCQECGNVNPEQIFDIMEAQVVNEYGQETGKRKTTPQEWAGLYEDTHNIVHFPDEQEAPPNSLNIPSKIKQWWIYTLRDFKSKASNLQYIIINLAQAPLLAFVLAFIIRYTNDPEGEGYLYRYNENIPAYMLMAIIVSLFMGLTVAAEEIIKDRKIERREKFLSLSRSSYLSSKLGLLFSLSAIQSAFFVLVGNTILEIPGQYFTYWLLLFSSSCFANILGLNISASFNSAVTVYIVIPLILIPQMILSGALFSFEKLHDSVSAKGTTPMISDIMASRWAYEALAVEQFRTGEYEALYFENDFNLSYASYHEAYLIPEVIKALNKCRSLFREGSDSTKALIPKELAYVRSGVDILSTEVKKIKAPESISTADITYSLDLDKELRGYFEACTHAFNKVYNHHSETRDKLTNKLKKIYGEYDISLNDLRDLTFNERLDEVVRNINTDHRVLRHDGKLIRQLDPVFALPNPGSALDYRAPFFASQKHIFGFYTDTFTFNLLVIWFMSILLYITLYYEAFKKLMTLFERIKFNRSKS